MTEEGVDRVIVWMRELFADGAAAGRIDEFLRRAPVRVVPALDRALRDGGLHARLGFGFVDWTKDHVARLERFGEHANALLGVASLVRDGHAREAAVLRLQGRVDRLTTAFLINRLNDYVQSVAALAWAALVPRLDPRLAEWWVACAPLVDRLSEWRRGQEWQARLQAFLRSPHPTVRAALWAGLRAGDGDVVRSVGAVLVAEHRGTAEMQPVLEALLAIREPRTRRWAARLAADADWTPPAVFRALAPRMEADRAPAIRVLGLAGRVQRGDAEAVGRMAFDVNAEVRHQARVALATAFTPLDYRGRALEMLSEETGASATIAALAILSEFGRAEDTPLVRRFAEDRRPAVAREARRTLGRLPAP